jgi:hypothetical protein
MSSSRQRRPKICVRENARAVGRGDRDRGVRRPEVDADGVGGHDATLGHHAGIY